MNQSCNFHPHTKTEFIHAARNHILSQQFAEEGFIGLSNKALNQSVKSSVNSSIVASIEKPYVDIKFRESTKNIIDSGKGVSPNELSFNNEFS